MSNQIMVIYPYFDRGLWVFDDESVGLTREPFVAGIDNIIDFMTIGVNNARQGFRLLFSADPFPDYTTSLTWIEKDKDPISSGDWYYHLATGTRGWLCPALLKYFDKAPKEIYVKIEEVKP